jgi:hypothetical protein
MSYQSVLLDAFATTFGQMTGEQRSNDDDDDGTPHRVATFQFPYSSHDGQRVGMLCLIYSLCVTYK